MGVICGKHNTESIVTKIPGGARFSCAECNIERAAPALLDALEGLMNLESRGRIMPIGKEWDKARAAIAAARGN